MKYILFFILIPILANAQRFDARKINGVDYVVRQDTSATGTVTVVYTPTASLQSDVDSQVASIDGEIAVLQDQRNQINARIKELNYQRAQLTGVKQKLGLK